MKQKENNSGRFMRAVAATAAPLDTPSFYVLLMCAVLLSAMASGLTTLIVAKSYSMGVFSYQKIIEESVGVDAPMGRVEVNVFGVSSSVNGSAISVDGYEKLIDRDVSGGYYQLNTNGRTDRTDFTALMESITLKNARNGYAGCDSQGNCLSVLLIPTVELNYAVGTAGGICGLDANDRVAWANLPSDTLSTADSGVTYPPLNASGVIPEQFLPGFSGSGTPLVFISTWDPVNNVPPLTDSSGNNGDFYICMPAAGAPVPVVRQLGDISTWSAGVGLLRYGDRWYQLNQASTGVNSLNGLVNDVNLNLRDLVGVDPAAVPTDGQVLQASQGLWRPAVIGSARPYVAARMTTVSVEEATAINAILLLKIWTVTHAEGDLAIANPVGSGSILNPVQELVVSSAGWYYVSASVTTTLTSGSSFYVIHIIAKNPSDPTGSSPGIKAQKFYRNNSGCDWAGSTATRCATSVAIRQAIYFNANDRVSVGITKDASLSMLYDNTPYTPIAGINSPSSLFFMMKIA